VILPEIVRVGKGVALNVAAVAPAPFTTTVSAAPLARGIQKRYEVITLQSARHKKLEIFSIFKIPL
jgi:hypothetical protein